MLEARRAIDEAGKKRGGAMPSFASGTYKNQEQ